MRSEGWKRMIERHKRTQVGYLVIVVYAAILVLTGAALANNGINWAAMGSSP